MEPMEVDDVQNVIDVDDDSDVEVLDGGSHSIQSVNNNNNTTPTKRITRFKQEFKASVHRTSKTCLIELDDSPMSPEAPRCTEKLRCGHRCQALTEHEHSPDAIENEPLCFEGVETQLPCGHIERIACCVVDRESVQCSAICGQPLGCDQHLCFRLCKDPHEHTICQTMVPVQCDACEEMYDVPCYEVRTKKHFYCGLQRNEVFECGHFFQYQCPEKKPEKCTEICRKMLECQQHHCSFKCSEEHNHKCNFLVKLDRPCGHSLVRGCEEASSPYCEERISEKLKCGHEVYLPCKEKGRDIRCPERVPIALPCKHVQFVDCGEKEDTNRVCTEIVLVLLDCGHSVDGPCGSSPPAMCPYSKDVDLPCGHQMPNVCYLSKKKVQCHQLVEYQLSCGHVSLVACCELKLKNFKPEPCHQMLRTPCIHKSVRTCAEQKETCQKIVTVTLPCSHAVSVTCSEYTSPNFTPICNAQKIQRFTGCHHTFARRCGETWPTSCQECEKEAKKPDPVVAKKKRKVSYTNTAGASAAPNQPPPGQNVPQSVGGTSNAPLPQPTSSLPMPSNYHPAMKAALTKLSKTFATHSLSSNQKRLQQLEDELKRLEARLSTLQPNSNEAHATQKKIDLQKNMIYLLSCLLNQNTAQAAPSGSGAPGAGFGPLIGSSATVSSSTIGQMAQSLSSRLNPVPQPASLLGNFGVNQGPTGHLSAETVVESQTTIQAGAQREHIDNQNLVAAAAEPFSKEILVDSAEFRIVAEKISKYVEFPIEKVEKIVNKKALAMYDSVKDDLIDPLNTDLKVYSNTARHLARIVKEGFSPADLEKGPYGNGLYFYSKFTEDQYILHNNCVLLCDVLLGNSMTMDTPQETVLSGLKDFGYDSIYGQSHVMAITERFVVLDHRQAYPKYVVYFKETAMDVCRILMRPSPYVDEKDQLQIQYRLIMNKLASENFMHKVQDIEHVQNVFVKQKFELKQLEYQALYGEDAVESKKILAFHGTLSCRVPSILKNNFSLSFAGVNGQAYGRGVYFSDSPNIALGYAKDCDYVIACYILPGKVKVVNGNEEHPLFNSHRANMRGWGEIMVIKTVEQIQPTFIVSLKRK